MKTQNRFATNLLSSHITYKRDIKKSYMTYAKNRIEAAKDKDIASLSDQEYAKLLIKFIYIYTSFDTDRNLYKYMYNDLLEKIKGEDISCTL